MGRPPTIPPEKKTRIVLAILAGDMSIAEAARKEKVSEQSIGRWKAEFIEAGRTALVAGRSGPSSREEQLDAEVVELTQALGEAQWSCGSGRRAPRAGWALRGPRGNPHCGGDVDREVLQATRHP
jgi:transposase